MFSSDELDNIRRFLEQLCPLKETKINEQCYDQKKKYKDEKAGKEKQPNQKGKQSNQNQNGKEDNTPCITLSPTQLLVIAGFIGGVLEVNSVLVDRDQGVQILLAGSLKRKTDLDKIMEQVGKLPFDQVIKSIMDGAEY